MIQGAIFDLDGLLVDTQKIYQIGMKEIGKKYEIAMTDSLAKEYTGASPDHIAKEIELKFSVDGVAYINDVLEYVAKQELNDLSLKPGVKEMLTYLQSFKIPMAVASGSPRALIDRNLKLVDIDAYFSVIVSTQEVEHGKPAPDIFLEAAHRLNVDPKHCFVFEDAINGVHAGVSAGCKTIMIPDRLKPEKDFYKTTYGIFDNLHAAMNQIKCMME